MKTLVYFASGNYRREYQDLNFDRIILIDHCFRQKSTASQITNKGKVTCVGMDCLEAIQYLRENNIRIDCFVSLNEGLYEGGGNYAINSDFFLGYIIPFFQDNYIHIMNKNYYQREHNVSMDLPFEMEEISANEKEFIDPFVFSKQDYHEGNAKVYRMKKVHDTQELVLSSKIKTTMYHDSIWGYYDQLDALAISFSEQGQKMFFDDLPKVINLRDCSINEVFEYCKTNKIEKIGFTPWGRGKYTSFIEQLQNYKDDYPKEISLFHLNQEDYKSIKNCVIQ